ncbi:sodium:calcium antiporter [Candidatus Gottesmanbacteria bacterium]|nr:sodium:calcium antiporter [Candidatus Gottesmanbacteria bacterium]
MIEGGHMNLWWHIGILIGFGFVLSGSANLVVGATLALARRLGLTGFTIGFLLLGILTSTPEISLAIQSSLTGLPQLSTGDLIGGQILILSLMMGTLTLILGKVALDHRLSWRDLVSMCAVIAAPALVLWDGALTRGEGIFLVGTYAVHAMLLTHDGKAIHHLERYHSHHHTHLGHVIGLFVMGILGIIIASRVIVTNASVIVQSFFISPLVFGLFFLSFGTNLPEMALAFGALRHRGKEIAIGDFLGSAAANTLILGFLGIMSPYRASDPHRVVPALVLLLSLTVFFLWSFWTGKSLSRREGVGLLAFYALFVAYELVG